MLRKKLLRNNQKYGEMKEAKKKKETEKRNKRRRKNNRNYRWKTLQHTSQIWHLLNNGKLIKFTISYQLKLLGQVVIYHDIRAGNPKFEPCLHSTSYLKS